MKSAARKLVNSVHELLERVTVVSIDRCYHFRGYRYGGFGHNPYEDYILGLSAGRELLELRSTFAKPMLNNAPRNMGEALGLDMKHVPPWEFPWDRAPSTGWQPILDPAMNPDIVCHYCPTGVLASHVNREFAWLEASFESIRREGYKPDSLGYIRCLRFVGDGLSSYLVLDGNHRISALHAIGTGHVSVKVLPRTIRRSDVARWPRVRDGTYSIATALLVFDRYFAQSNPPLPCLNLTPLVSDEPPLWQALQDESSGSGG